MLKVLILLSTYNGEDYLEELLNSVLNQSSVEVKVLIRDDFSTDGTIDVLTRFKRISPNQITLIAGKTNLGYKASFNFLMKYAHQHFSFDYIAFCDQDDVWYSNKLISALDKLVNIAANGKPKLYFSNLTVTDRFLNPRNEFFDRAPSLDFTKRLIENKAVGCTIVFNKWTLIKYLSVLRGDEENHDHLIFLVALIYGQVVYDKKSHIYYRQHNNNQIGYNSLMSKLKNRLTNFRSINKRPIESRAGYLISALDNIPNGNKYILTKFISYRHSLKTKMQILLGSQFSKESRLDNFFFKFKVLFNLI